MGRSTLGRDARGQLSVRCAHARGKISPQPGVLVTDALLLFSLEPRKHVRRRNRQQEDYICFIEHSNLTSLILPCCPFLLTSI